MDKADYYGNANPDILNSLEVASSVRICEFGCGMGELARVYKLRNPSCHYVGVEISEEAATLAKEFINVVLNKNLDLIPNWDSDKEMHESLPYDSFDYVIFGDVLEHLYDPYNVLSQAVARLKPNGKVIACIPNVQYWTVFLQLLRGSWPQEDSGLFDRTHIRWFALNDMLSLFKKAGATVESVKPRFPRLSPAADEVRAKMIQRLFPLVSEFCGGDLKIFERNASALQYVIVAKK